MHHWLEHWSGYDGQGVYDLESGIIALLLGAGFWANWYTTARRHNCHHPRCFRISRHMITDSDGTSHGACRKHREHVLATVRSQ